MNDARADEPSPRGVTRWWRNPALARAAFGAPTFAEHDASGTAGPDLADPAQREFGEYELLELIGRGGMGLVYRARQRGLAREVAIKLLSGGPWASPEFVARFEQEARHAAQLQHPGIVAIHELGESVDGVYYAMQLVRGESLAQRLHAGDRWTPREAAALLRQIGEAVAYAHSLGVLHLDLKPGNVLIDEQGHPLIADFGLARRIEAATDDDCVAGTPGYMAPEQAIAGHPLNEATDVWALGAILHELLCGRAPGDDDGNALAAIPADLRQICRKCIAKTPEQRYSSARALADDLGRFLDGRAVQARPLNALQRLPRWAKREPKLVSAIALGLVVLLAGLLASLLMWQRAVRNAEQAQEVNRFLNEDVLAAANPELEYGKDGAQISVASLLASAESKLDSGLVRQPVVRAQTGLSIGRAYFGLGLWGQAVPRLRKAHADAVSTLGANAPLSLDIEDQLGLALTYNGDHPEAMTLYRHLLPARRQLSGQQAPATIKARQGYAALLYESDRFEESAAEYEAARAAAIAHAPQLLPDISWNLAELYAELNRWDEAERLLRDTLQDSRKQLGPNNPHYLWQTLSLVDLLNMRAKWDEAEALATATRTRLIATVGPSHPKAISATHYLGQIELARGHPQQALPLLQEALRERTRVHGESHKWTQYTANRVGEALLALNRPEEAAAILEHNLDLATRAGRRQQPYVLILLDNLIRTDMALGRMESAERLLDEALATARQSVPTNNLRRGLVERVAGDFFARQGRIEEAKQHYRRALTIFSSGYGKTHPLVIELDTSLARLSDRQR